MAIRIGPGPVFVYESLIFCRRWQVYAGRALFVLAILIGLWAAWWSNLNGPAYGQPFGTRPGNMQALAQPASRSSGAGRHPAHVGPPGGAGGDRRGDLPRPGAGHPGADGDHRPLRRRDRAGQALLAAGPDPGPARLRPARDGDGRAAGRRRHPGARQPVRRLGRGRRPGVHARDGGLGGGRQDSRGDHGRAGPLDPLADEPADLDGDVAVQRHILRRRSGTRRPIPSCWSTRPTPGRATSTRSTSRCSRPGP